jgi:hypothetical protein
MKIITAFYTSSRDGHSRDYMGTQRWKLTESVMHLSDPCSNQTEWLA